MTGIGRLPMHSVAHADRLALDGRWRFQLLASARRPSPGRTGPRRTSRASGRCRAPGTARTTPTSRCRSRACRRTIPDAEPDRRLRARRSRCPTAWAGRRIVLHVGAAESVLIVEPQRRRDRHRQGLAPRLRVRPDRPPAPGQQHADRCASSSGPTRRYVEDQDQWWHGGITRSVFLYATRDVYLADVRVDRRPRGRPDDRHARPDRRRSASRAASCRPAGPSRRRSTARRAARRRRDPIDRGAPGWTRDDQRLMYRHAAGLLPPDGRAAWDGVHAGWRRRSTASSPGTSTSRTSRRWSAERPDLYPLRVVAPRPRPARSPRRRPSRSASGGSRSRARPAGQRRARPHPRRQPPRLRPAHRPRHLAASRCAPTSS